jgi:ubiquinol-cytochrome c reductase iron-sulfur subunit
MSDHSSAPASAEVDQDRRGFLTFATAATGVVGVAFATVPFIASWSPSERARAAGAPVEVDVTKLEPGQMVVVTYRKKPMYVVRRTPEMLEQLAGHDGQLKDPESRESEQPEYTRNTARAAKPEILVLDGTCTHLGCLPKSALRGCHSRPGRGLAGRILLPLPWLEVRPVRSRVRGFTGIDQPAHPAEYSFRDETLVIGVAPSEKGVA